METKACLTCGVVKAYTEFYKRGKYLQSYCKSCDGAKSTQWNRDNPEKAKAIGRKSYHKRKAANPEKMMEAGRKRSRKFRAANPEKVRESRSKSHTAHPETRRRLNSKRRAKKAGAEGGHTTQELEWLIAFQGFNCLYCEADLMTVKWAFDHIVPLDKGGSDYIQNICVACMSCNSSKGTKSVVDFMSW